MTEPVVRLTSVEKMDHRETFENFAERLADRIVGDRGRDQPRVVSLLERIVR
jgi:hypothetical protein